jgi:hypothetical protein
MDDQVAKALANEARRNELRQKIAELRGKMSATGSMIQKLGSVNSDSGIMMTDYQAELAALEAGAGPGVTADFGLKSDTTQLIERERFAAKAAVVAFVHANPACSEADAVGAWQQAALASHPDFPMVIQDGAAMELLYRRNLLASSDIPDDTWEAHRNYILFRMDPNTAIAESVQSD